MKKDYQIELKITGSGTPDEIVETLHKVAQEIAWQAGNNGAESLDGQVWENPTLLTEINLLNENF